MTSSTPLSAETDPRSGPEERDYLLKRADSHRRLAERTQETGSRAIHLNMERLYLQRAEAIA